MQFIYDDILGALSQVILEDSMFWEISFQGEVRGSLEEEYRVGGD